MSAHDLIKKTKKILTAPQYKFLKQLAYWSLNSKDYGLRKDGKTWIYNTHQQWAEQIGYGVTTVRESIAFLEQLGFISSDFLNPNKRRRVKYYSINFENIENFFAEQASRKAKKPSVQNVTETASVSTVSEPSKRQLNRQMERQMYTYNKIQDNKSYKSQIASVGDHFGQCTDSTVCRTNDKNYSDTEKIVSVRDSHTSVSMYSKTESSVTLAAEDSHTSVSVNSNNTGCRNILPCQDMIKIWNQEFPNQKIISGSTEQTGIIHLTKHLARYLVASFKLKFENSLEKWRRYLRLIKTSAYMMGDKFKLSVMWVIKFLTIDRIRAGELGVDERKIKIDQSEIEQKAIAHASSVEESETCKQFRHEIIKKLSPAVYLSWFTKVDLIEESKKLIIRAANDFVRDYIKANFIEKISRCFKYFDWVRI